MMMFERGGRRGVNFKINLAKNERNCKKIYIPEFIFYDLETPTKIKIIKKKFFI
jgi:hypothetical protein